MGRVAVLMGGLSAEREISLKTGRAIAESLRRSNRDVVEIDVDRNLPVKLIEADAESAFVALHGRWGEDGTVQGLLETMGIPYTGSGVTASALAMNKRIAKIIFRASGVLTPDFQSIKPEDGVAALEIAPPFVAKPVSEGSTIGVGVARTMEQAEAAIAEARAAGGDRSEILIETFVEGREVTLGVVGGEVFPLVEVIPESGFYDFEAKYTPGRTRYACPAELPEKTAKAAERAGFKAYRALGCEGAARVDLIVDSSGRAWVLEVNTIPGMTPTSLLPKAAAAVGIGFDELVLRIIDSAGLKA